MYPSQKKATICEGTLKALVEAIGSLRDEMRSLASSADAATTGLVSGPASKDMPASLDKVRFGSM